MIKTERRKPRNVKMTAAEYGAIVKHARSRGIAFAQFIRQAAIVKMRQDNEYDKAVKEAAREEARRSALNNLPE